MSELGPGVELAYWEPDRARSRRVARPRCRRIRRRTPRPVASSPVTMFWGMMAPEKPPLRIAKRDVVVGYRALVEVRPLHAQRPVGGPWVPAAVSVWQPEQRSANSTAPASCGILRGHRDPLGAAGGEDKAAAAADREREDGGRRTRAPSYFPPRGSEPSTRCPPTDRAGRASRRDVAASRPASPWSPPIGPAGPAGRAANAVASLSLEPPLMLACLDLRLAHAGAVEHAPAASASTCSRADQPSSPGASAPRTPIPEKWDGVAWQERAGTPTIDGALIWLGCELRDVIDGGDHVIATGEVLDLEQSDGEPLIFHHGEYRPLADDAEASAARGGRRPRSARPKMTSAETAMIPVSRRKIASGDRALAIARQRLEVEALELGSAAPARAPSASSATRPATRRRRSGGRRGPRGPRGAGSRRGRPGRRPPPGRSGARTRSRPTAGGGTRRRRPRPRRRGWRRGP